MSGIMATTVRPATEEDLAARSATGARCELVDGEIREMSPAGGRHGQVSVNLLFLLSTFVRARSGGILFDSSTGFRLPSGNVRAPDVAFVAAGRLEGDRAPVGFVPLAPDLAVEVRSPEEREREVLDKVGEYLQAGTRVVWVVDAETRTVALYRSPADVTTVREHEVLDGGDVLPGFCCRPAEFL